MVQEKETQGNKKRIIYFIKQGITGYPTGWGSMVTINYSTAYLYGIKMAYPQAMNL